MKKPFTNTKLDNFFQKMDNLGLALTYDDVKLETNYSEIMPDETILNSYFSRNISLKIPIISAAMDTVTENKMAIALAKAGGIGVIHRGLSPLKQAEQVNSVKLYMNGLIKKPVTFQPNQTLQEIVLRKQEKNYSFSTFPIVDENFKLIGLITSSDFDFCNANTYIKNTMTKDLFTMPENTSIKQAYDIMKKEKRKILPLIDEQRILKGLYVWKDVKRIIEQNNNFINTDTNGQLRVAAAIGVHDYERVENLIYKNVDALVIDTAHADTKGVIETIKELKKKYDVDVVVGNISSPESVKRLISAGADAIKIGQGPGSICTTRIIAGIGAPQLTAIYECAKQANIYDPTIPIIADGGLKYSGDIPVAISAGADAVMMGSMFAGTEESPGEIIYYNGRQWKSYRGMGSLSAMQDSKSSRERYGQKDTGKDSIIPEGIDGLTPFKGSIDKIIIQYIGGLQRGMGYLGAKTIQELKEKSNFHRITSAGVKESHPHDVVITKEAPNYSRGN